jgi:hypothetical protein
MHNRAALYVSRMPISINHYANARNHLQLHVGAIENAADVASALDRFYAGL